MFLFSMAAKNKKFKKFIELSFNSKEEKDNFNEQWNGFRKKRPDLSTIVQVMYYFLSLAVKCTDTGNEAVPDANFHYNSFVNITKEQSKCERLFVTCESSINSLVGAVYSLGQRCHFSRTVIVTRLEDFANFVATFTISNGKHTFLWKSSPYIEGWSKFFVNEKMACGLVCSGLMYTPFTRFLNATTLGSTNERVYNETCNRLSTIISNEAKASKERAIQNSLAGSGASGITMETDACFSAFRNAKRSITFGLCNETHTVLADKVKSTNH
ncbi:unnamed protein product, partial [Owenia fusiformis]